MPASAHPPVDLGDDLLLFGSDIVDHGSDSLDGLGELGIASHSCSLSRSFRVVNPVVAEHGLELDVHEVLPVLRIGSNVAFQGLLGVIALDSEGVQDFIPRWSSHTLLIDAGE